MNQIKTNILNLAPKILKKYPVAFAYLYGSYANGLEHSFSDIDICIYADNIPADKKLSIQMAISLEIDEKLKINAKTEVRLMNDLPLVIKGQIVTEGILIYSIDDDLRADVESYIRKTYFDFLPVIQEYQKSYIDHVVS
jgi:predicted nucleotidyltransferase